MKYYVALFVLVGIIMCGACASIVGHSTYPVSINSNPENATVIIKNKNGVEVHKATTPTLVTLPSGAGYFSSESYTIECQKEGYYKATSNLSTKMDPWYWGNILGGGLIGLLIVDPLTGAMWKLDEKAFVSLTPDPTYISKGIIPQTPRRASLAELTLPDSGKDLPIVADIDINIPLTNMKNSDAIAVVIGNRTYKNSDVPEVKFAHNDAKLMKEYLIKMLGYKESNIIFKLDATKAEFEQIFGNKGEYEGQLYDLIKPEKSDVFIYYSGHGAPDIATLKGYFVPSDCVSTKFALSGYSLDVFYENTSQLKAKTVTIVLDACFSGGSSTGKYLIASSSVFGIKVSNPTVAKGNSICMASSEGNQISSWYDSNNHGLFTYFFLKGLRGDADKNKDHILTYEELYEFVSDNTEGVPYWARRLHEGRKQNPTIMGVNLGRTLVKY